jgi:hypothetical protein
MGSLFFFATRVKVAACLVVPPWGGWVTKSDKFWNR